MWKPKDFSTDGITSKLSTATRLHFLVCEEMGIRYGDVVRRCLYQSFDVRDLSLDAEETQEVVIDNVYTPLLNDFIAFDGSLDIR